jgi:EmrB/QacA subfamily drug resistance transporter
MTVTANDPTVLPAPSHKRVLVIFSALMLVMSLAAIDGTIVATALPTIAADLGGVDLMPWVVTAYLLGTAVVGPLYGKLGDIFGRKIILQTAIVIFLVGSVLCGMAQGIVELIIFRTIQGFGGGGLLVTTVAVVADIVAPSERGRYQGLIGSAVAVSTLIGPLLGGFLVDSLSWRWIFYVNLPVGIAAFVVIQLVFRTRPARAFHSIDYLGAALIAGALASFILVASLGGTTYPWGSPQIIVLAVAAVTLLGWFIANERRVKEPIIPLSLFRIRTFVVTSIVGFTISIGFFGAQTYLPLYLQLVRGLSPSESGLHIAPMLFGTIVAAVGSGRLIVRLGRYRLFPIAGMALAVISLVALAQLSVTTPAWQTTLTMVVLGVGFGVTIPVIMLAAQNAVDYGVLGVVTSTTAVFRWMGAAIGVAVLGAVFTAQLASNLSGAFPAGSTLPTTANPAEVRLLPADVRDTYIEAIVDSLGPMFLTGAAIATIGFAVSLLLREVPLRSTIRGGAEPAGAQQAEPLPAAPASLPTTSPS